MADIYSAALATVQFVYRPIWRYSKNQYQYKANSEAFNARKEELRQLQERIQSKLNTELQAGRKIARPDVVTWLTVAGQEINKQSVEDEVSQSGCLSSCICRTRVLTRRTADLVQIYERGESLSQMPSLVDDDDIQIYKELKENLQCKLQDVKSRLHTQLQEPWKIETEGVKLWLRNVEEKTGPAATSFENQFNNVQYDGGFFTLVKERNQQLVELLNDRAVRSESLIGDDYSQTLGDGERQIFEEWKDKLQGKHRDVKEKLTAELHPGKIVTEDVQQWLQKVEDITIPAASKVQNQLSSGHPPYLASLVARVKELIQEMEELCNKGDQLPESLVVDDLSTPKLELLAPELQGSASDAVKAEIRGHLMGDETSKIGVWGMGGVGKTTIMKHVYNQLLNESKFKKVIWVTVSQTFDVQRIQQEIASSFQKDEILPNQQGGHLRAATLSKMLERHKPYALILDDVWESIELREVGIPEICGSKLVLTTRSEEVARVMGCKRVKVNTLSHDASLKLFKEKAGVEALSEDGGAEKTLEEMVRECDGLPLAIITVGASMKGISDPCMWRAALNQLKEGKRNVAGTENDQFHTLKFSYDRLSDEKIKHCYLHCAMYPEDKMIPKEELIEYWIDEELIDVMGSRQDMKDQGHANLNKLVENCLLEESGDEQSCVKMHDVMRDMALWITRTSSPRCLVKAGMGLRELPEEHEWKEDLLKVSLMSNHIDDIPSSMPSPRCPILTTLLLFGNHISTIPELFFEHMPALKVLDLSDNRNLRSLPSSVSQMVKLTTLLLRSCNSLKEVPSLSNLTALKKLDLYGVGVEEVPHGVEMLLNLKYLDIRRSSGDRVSTGWKMLVSEILPNLSKLQHLRLDHRLPVEGGQLSGIWPKLEIFYGGFRTWSDMCIFLSKRQKSLYHYNIYVGDPNNMGYANLYFLKYIRCVGINICGEPGSIPSDVQELLISDCNDVRRLDAISGFQDVFDLQDVEIRDCREVEYAFSGLNQLSKLKWLELSCLENLKGLFDSEAPLAVFSSLEEISIRGCPKIKMLLPTTLQFLPNLKKVSVSDCSQLEEIMVAPLVNFSSLEVISIEGCPKIKKLFPTTLQYLPNLKEVSIDNCSQLEEIMVASSEEEEGRVIHAKLEKLELDDLPMLRSISSLTGATVFDFLKDLHISGCWNLEYVFGGKFKFNSLQTLESMVLEGLHSLKSIFHEEADESLAFGAPLSGTQTISFPLKQLQVVDCPQLKNIFPHAVQLDSFKNLAWIEVKGCDRLEEIMAASSETEEDQSEPILPKLNRLYLIELPVLRRICSALLVPDSLRILTIEDCPNLSWECLFGLHVELPQNLCYLTLKGVRKLESVFDEEASDSLAFWRLPPAATTSFALETIRIENCDELEEIISSKSEEEPLKVTHLPKLMELKMRNLPKLKRVCTATSALICDSLQFLTISGCTDLKRFPLHLPVSANGQLSPPPHLRKIELSDKEKEWWESLEWDQPNAEAVLSPLCIFKWEMKYQFSWTPPSPGYLKLNVGACKSQTQLATAAGLIRNSNGSWIKGFMVHLGDATVFTAELWGIRTGLAIARSLNITHLIVETDSTSVVINLTSSTNRTDPDFTLVKDCSGFRLCFKSCPIWQIHREENVCAHYLANEALLMPQGITYLESPPEGLRTLLWKDATGKSEKDSSEEDSSEEDVKERILPTFYKIMLQF